MSITEIKNKIVFFFFFRLIKIRTYHGLLHTYGYGWHIYRNQVQDIFFLLAHCRCYRKALCYIKFLDFSYSYFLEERKIQKKYYVLYFEKDNGFKNHDCNVLWLTLFYS